MAARRGHKRAIVAVVHTILIIVYHLLRNSDTYCDPGPAYFDERDRALLQRLGYAVHLEKALPA